MKLNLRLTADNVGDVVYLETEDGFKSQGEIVTVSETSVEVRDVTTHAILTIFLFEITNFVIVNSKGKESLENMTHVQIPRKAVGPGAFIKMEVEVEKVKPGHYDHPIFGRLSHNECVLTFQEITAAEQNMEHGICKYMTITDKNNLYEESIPYFKSSPVIGVSYYESVEPQFFKYIIVSCTSFSMLLDLGEKDYEQLYDSYIDIFNILTDEQQLKVVYGGPNLFFFLHTHFKIQILNFIDLQIFHYGLHNIRVTEPLRQHIPYAEMVELLFNVSFKKKGKAYFTTNDAINKLAFNTHFLIPMYKFMLNRLLEPVKVISNRVCRINIEELQSDAVSADLHLTPCSYDNFDILPRSLQFWTYRDTSSMLQAKKVVETELHTEKQEFTKNTSDVVEINKSLLHMKEEREKVCVTYIETLSEDEEDEEVLAYKQSNSSWRNPQDDNFMKEKVEEDVMPKRLLSGIGRGRGMCKDANDIRLIPGSIEVANNRFEKQLNVQIPNSESNKKFDDEAILRDVTHEDNKQSPEREPVRVNGFGRGRFVTNKSVSPMCTPDSVRSYGPGSTTPHSSILYNTKNQTRKSYSPFNTNNGLPHDHKQSLGRGVSPLKNLRPSFNDYADDEEPVSFSVTSSIENITKVTSQMNKDVDFCELPQTSWNKKRVGKLSLHEYRSEGITAEKEAFSEAQGVLWAEVSARGEEITDNLYKQFGLQ